MGDVIDLAAERWKRGLGLRVVEGGRADAEIYDCALYFSDPASGDGDESVVTVHYWNGNEWERIF